MAGAAIGERAVAVWGGRLTMRVRIAGSGPPLVYLHPAAGLHFDPFLEALGADWTVIAPEHPGTSAGDPEAIHAVDDLWDLVLVYQEAIAALGLERPVVAVGQSFGGMMAAELAAHDPALFERLVLLAPIGLWREDRPIANWIMTPPDELPALLFKDPGCAAAQAMFTPPEDPGEAVAATAGLVWALGCTGKFVWPIPEKGLSRRLHRVRAPTLIVWGADDALIPSAYAAEFGTRIAGSQVEILPDCGHIPQLERAAETLALVRGFLAG